MKKSLLAVATVLFLANLPSALASVSVTVSKGPLSFTFSNRPRPVVVREVEVVRLIPPRTVAVPVIWAGDYRDFYLGDHVHLDGLNEPSTVIALCPDGTLLARSTVTGLVHRVPRVDAALARGYSMARGIYVGETGYVEGDNAPVVVVGVYGDGSLAVRMSNGAVVRRSDGDFALARGCISTGHLCVGDSVRPVGRNEYATIVGAYGDNTVSIRDNRTGLIERRHYRELALASADCATTTTTVVAPLPSVVVSPIVTTTRYIEDRYRPRATVVVSRPRTTVVVSRPVVYRPVVYRPVVYRPVVVAPAPVIIRPRAPTVEVHARLPMLPHHRLLFGKDSKDSRRDSDRDRGRDRDKAREKDRDGKRDRD